MTTIVAVVASCMVSEPESIESIDIKKELTITASRSDPETRTERAADGAVLWSPGDEISLFYGSGNKGGSRFIAHNTEPAKVVNFTGTIGVITGGNDIAVEDTYFWAVYPYNASSSCDGSSITTSLHSSQLAIADTFADDLFPSVGRSQGLTMGFYNICGGLKITISEAGIKSVTLHGHNNETLAGQLTVSLDDTGRPIITGIEGGSETITVSAPTGDCFEVGHAYYIVIIPTVFENGFTLTFDKEGYRAVYDRSKSTTIRRSAFGSLNTPDAGLEWEERISVHTVPPDNEIWYRTTDNQVFDVMQCWSGQPFNVNVVTNNYENGIGVIRCDGSITQINSGVFYRNNSNTLVELYLPDCVESLGHDSIHLTQLKSLRIPSSLKSTSDFGWNGYLELFSGDQVSNDGKCVIVDGVLCAFAGRNLKSYTFPTEIRSIATQVCSNFPELESIVLPDGLEHIGEGAFLGDSGLKQVSFPSSLISIDECAFHGCSSIEGFYGNDLFHTPDNKCLITYRHNNPYGNENANGKWLSAFVGKGVTEYELPNGIVGIERFAFVNADLNSLIIPESLAEIEDDALGTGSRNCGRIGAIYGPNTTSDHKCFVVDDELKFYLARRGLTSYSIPDNIKIISSSAFCNCFELEEIYMGDNVQEISGGCFRDSPHLREATLSANLTSIIGADPFLRCPCLRTIYMRSVVPPSYDDSSDIPAPDLKIYVPEQSLDSYKKSRGWLSHINNFYGLYYSDLPSLDYYVSTDYSKDGNVVSLQSATIGAGIDVVIIGDAYSDRQIDNGTYHNAMQTICNYFFSEEPYKSYKEYFNVYYVNVVSATEGYDKPGSALYGHQKYRSSLLETTCIDYARKAIDENRLDEATLIVAFNSDQPDPYSGLIGEASLFEPQKYSDYGSGLGIAYIANGISENTTMELIHHEACGHAFAKLDDEYASYYEISADQKEGAIWNRNHFGWWKNTDYTDDPSTILWSQFLSDERYLNEGVGIFEGGGCFSKGVWRPSENSIMRYNTGGFNAPSRYAIWYRINKLAYGEDWNGSYEGFVEYDAVNRTPKSASKLKTMNSVVRLEPHLDPPVIIRHSQLGEK